MKRLIIAGMVLLVIFTIFAACASRGDNNSEDSRGTLSLSSDSSLAAPDVQYIRVGSGFGPRNPTYTVISSVNELNQFSNNLNNNSFWETEYRNVIANYSNVYFADNFLVMVQLEENSGSNRHKVERIDRNGDIIIEQLIPEIGTADMATWNIIIELNNSLKREQFQVILK